MGKRKQPEWFEGNAEELLPLIEAKNEVHKWMVSIGSLEATKEFRQRQRMVKTGVDKTKEEWIRRVTKGRGD